MRVCPRCRSIYAVAADRCGIDGTAIVEQDADPLVGEEVDRYRIIEPLGRGAMGSVYRAAHSVLESVCAIKVLYGNFAAEHRLIERFRREAQAIAKMHHPNIVDVLDFGRTAAGLTFLVMELVEGNTLEDAIERGAPFSPVRAAQIARQIASGLGEAHRRGFVHRDMKPSNVMLADAGGIEVVKILDFGLVGLIEETSGAKLTAEGHIVGTPAYMAPEQAQSSRVTPAADLYTLGVILFEMLSGRPPFECAGFAEMLLMHMTKPPPPPPESAGLGRLASALLEKRPERRPSSAAQVIAEIDRLNLRAASTQQVLLVQRLDVPHEIAAGAASEWVETAEIDTDRHEVDELRRATIPMPRVASGDPGGVLPPLVAPPLVGPPVADLAGLHGPTERDFRPQHGSEGAEPFSASSADTTPPEAEDGTEDTLKRPNKISLSELTIRDTPPHDLHLEPVILPSAPARRAKPSAALIIAILAFAALFAAAILALLFA